MNYKPIQKSQDDHLVSKADQVDYCTRNSIDSKILIKMKLFCFIILFAIAHVSANDKENGAKYKKEVFITNCAIELADHRITIGDKIIENGLEYVIEKMVYSEDRYIHYERFEKINFMIAVPEYKKLVIGIPDVLVYPNTITKSIAYQYDLQLEIANTLSIGMFKNNEPYINFESAKLKALAKNRRRRVFPALVNIIRRVLDGTKRDFPVIGMCRLLGLYLSARSPTSYIQRFDIDFDKESCNLWDGGNYIKYRKLNGQWMHIVQQNGNITLEPLEAQLPKKM